MRSAGGPFPPQKGKQYEIGYKGIHLGGNLMTTIAGYTIDFVNILATDPTDPSGIRQIVVPGLTSRGIELTLQGNIDRFSLIAGYAYNHVFFADESPLGPKGGRYDNSPEHIANAWIKYSLPEHSPLAGLGLSLGGKYVGNRIGWATNQYFLMPPYFTLDAAASMPINRFTISLNGYNILDKKYVIGYYASDLMVQVGSPTNWKINVAYAFH
jgi:iron complex outermembrane receptor protein